MATNTLPGTPQFDDVPQVGTADPERRNSPIQTDPEECFELVREEVGDEAAGCYFNDILYPDGTHVASGSTFLRCEQGVWYEVGSEVP
ncbi:MAG: hypothetical protein JWN85_4600 [Gammaproteobacteria bacterium]|nr:hypothetical protein [Gammaproteobacteria bacterium]